MSRKGISPIISAVLLLAVSLSVAALFSQWGPQTAKDLFDTTSNQTTETSVCTSADMNILSAVYSNKTVGYDNVTVALTVSGIDELQNVQLRAWSSNDVLMNTSEKFNLSEGVPGNKTVAVKSTPDRIEAVSRRCEDIAEDTDEIS